MTTITFNGIDFEMPSAGLDAKYFIKDGQRIGDPTTALERFTSVIEGLKLSPTGQDILRPLGDYSLIYATDFTLTHIEKYEAAQAAAHFRD